MTDLFTPEIKARLNNTSGTEAQKREDKAPLFTEDIKKRLQGTEPPTKTDKIDSFNFETSPLSFQAIDDMVRLFSTGATYGSLNAVDPNEAELTDMARERWPVAGTLAEIGGSALSPITRTIGAGAKALSPVGKGLWNWLGRAAVTSGEGATVGGLNAALSGRPEDILHDATLGAVLPHGVNLAGKAVSAPVKQATAWVANRKPQHYATAYNVAKSGTVEENEAFRRGMARKQYLPAMNRDERAAYSAGRALAKVSPSRASVQSALSSLPTGGFIHPSMFGISAMLPFVGSPRAGGEVAKFLGTVKGGLDVVDPRAVLPILAYEQQQRKRKDKRNRGQE